MDYTKANLFRIFKKFGLNEKETIVYLEAIKQEKMTPFTIAKATGIPRSSIYDIVMSLSLKGLVELETSDGIEKQQTLIKAKNPSELRSIVVKKRDDLTSLEWDLMNIIPMLKENFHKDKLSGDFRFYPGIEGAKKIYKLSLLNNLDMPMICFDYLFESDIFGSLNLDKIIDDIIKTNQTKKNVERRIVPLNIWTKNTLAYQVKRNLNYLNKKEIRYIDNKLFVINQRIEVVGDWINIVSVKEREIWGLTINSKLLAKTITSIFDIIWQFANPITPEIVKSWGEHPLEKIKKKRMIK